MGEALLEKIYFDAQHPACFGGSERLFQAVKAQGISRETVEKWLRGIDAFTIHRPKYKKFKRNKIVVTNIRDQYQADLNDMRYLADDNDGFNYILTVIDCFTRKAWAIPLKSKSGKDVLEGIQIVFKDGIPRKFQTDKGTEFRNKQVQTYLKKNKVKFFSTENDEIKAAMVERLNKTLKEKMFRYFSHHSVNRYVDILPDLMKSYNSSYHRAIKMAPNNVSETNVLKVYNNIYGEYFASKKKMTPKFAKGDFVRINTTKMIFQKGYEANFTIEVFKIVKVYKRFPPVYKVKDLADEDIKGTFYERELQKANEPKTFKLNKVIRDRTKKGVKQCYVSWIGYPPKFNSWVNKDDVWLLHNASK